MRGLILLILLVYSAPLAMAGAWPQEKGHAQVISTTYFAKADRAFDEVGNADEFANYSKLETRLYIEYGVSERWTLVAHPSFQDVSLETTLGAQSYRGFGQTELGARYHIWGEEKWRLSAQGGVIFEGGGENTPEAALGEGTTDYEARLLLGRSLDNRFFKAFAEGQLAYRARGAGEPDEWRLDLTAGARPIEELQIIGQIFHIQSTEAVFPRRTYSSTKTQISAVWDRENGRSLQFGLYGTIAGENIIEERGIIFGIWQKIY